MTLSLCQCQCGVLHVLCGFLWVLRFPSSSKVKVDRLCNITPKWEHVSGVGLTYPVQVVYPRVQCPRSTVTLTWINSREKSKDHSVAQALTLSFEFQSIKHFNSFAVGQVVVRCLKVKCEINDCTLANYLRWFSYLCFQETVRKEPSVFLIQL